jgi:hypothetical protein
MAEIETLKTELDLRKQILEAQNRAMENDIVRGTLSGDQERAARRAIDETTRLNDTLGETRLATDRVRESTARFSRESAGISGVSDAFNEVITAANKLVQPIFEASTRLNALASERKATIVELSEELGGSARLFTLFATDATSATNQLVSIQEDALGKLRGMYEIYGDTASAPLKSLTDAQANFIADALRTDQSFLSAQTAMTSFYGKAAGFKEGDGGQLVPDGFFRIQGVPIMDIMGGVTQAFEPFTNILKDESLGRSFAKDMLNPEDIDAANKELVRISAAIKGLGMSSESVKELVRQNFIRTGEATTDLFDTVVKASEIGQNAFGINAGLIASDINKMMQNSDLFGFRTADDFAKISARIRDVHINVEQLQTVMGRFNTFESAAGAVSQLNAALGTNFDSMELLTARYEDPAHFIELLREGLLSTGKSFAELPLAYQNMLTQQLGLNAEAISGIMDGRVRTEAELTAAQNRANDEYAKQENADVVLDERLKSRVKITRDMTEGLEDMSAQAERAAKMFGTIGTEIVETATRSQEKINELSSTYVTKMSAAYRSAFDLVANGDKIIIEKGLQFADDLIKTKLPQQISDITSRVITEYMKVLEASLDALESKQRRAALADFDKVVRSTTQTTPTSAQPAEDIVVKGNLSEGDRVILAQYGQLSAYKVDARDDIKAAPPTSANPTPAPEPVSRPTPVSALPNAVQASLQGVGTSLRIELDIGQLTDMILRDIMMNKSAVFGGVGG